jgi:hypothetical protein
MAKRFTDTAKWKKEFIKGLEAKYKLLWFYILDDCDHAGIWEVDFEVASIRIGEQVGYDDSFHALGSQIIPIGKNRWWITGFVSFQYGTLTPKNKMFEPVTKILLKHGIDITSNRMPLPMEDISPIDGVKDIDKVKDKVEVKVKVKEPVDDFSIEVEKLTDRVKIIEAIMTDEIYVEQLQLTHRGKDIKKAFEECYIHHSNAPNPPSTVGEWRQKLNTWLINTKNGTSKTTRTETINSRREDFARKHGTSPGG